MKLEFSMECVNGRCVEKGLPVCHIQRGGVPGCEEPRRPLRRAVSESFCSSTTTMLSQR